MNDGKQGTQRIEVAALAEEYIARLRRGETPSIDEYAEEYQEFASEIREVFPMLGMVEGLKPTDESLAEVAENVAAASSPAHGREVLPDLPDYRILREHGRGGMGVVYEAEQVSLGRRVALKVLPAGMRGDDTAVQRFRHEARAAANLHHSHIVPVFDVGQTELHSYYAMQFIAGDGLDQVIRALDDLRSGTYSASAANKSISSQLVETLTNVHAPDGVECEPGRQDRAQVDTARMANTSTANVAALAKKSHFFRNAARIGVEVASALQHAHEHGIVHRDIKPSNILLDTEGRSWVTDFGLAKTENVELTQTGNILGTLRYMSPERFSGPCDARGDIYALGATLYELMTLRPAHSARDHLEMIHAIKDKSPVSLRSVDSTIPKDLQTIVEKMMEKAPQRRYATAAMVANDLQRFLDGRPILARQVTALERVQLWAKNNKTVAGLLAALAVILVTVTAGAIVAASFYRNMAMNEQAALVTANEEGKTKQTINDFLIDDILGAANIQANTSDITLREALAKAANSIGARFVDEPIVEGEMRRTIGSALASLGQYQEAEVHLLRSLELLESALGPNDPRTMATTAELGRMYRDYEKPDLSEPYLRRYLDFAEATYGPDDERTIDALQMMGMTFEELHRQEEATVLLQQALDWYRTEAGDTHPKTVQAVLALGSLYLYNQQYDQAEPLIEEAAELAQQHLGMEQLLTMRSLEELATLRMYQRRYEEALPLLEESLQLAEARLGADHPAVITSLAKLSELHAKLGDWNQAIAAKRLESEKELRVYGEDSPLSIATFRELGELFSRASQPEEARTEIRKGMELARRILGENDWEVANCRFQLAKLDLKEGNYEQAAETLREVNAIAVAKFGESHVWSIQTLNKLGDAYHMLGDYEAAKPCRAKVLDGYIQHGADQMLVLGMRRMLALVHMRLEEFAEAVTELKRGLAQLDKMDNPDRALREEGALFQMELANCYLRLQQHDLAEAAIRNAMQFEDWRHAFWGYRAQSILGEVLTQQGRFAEAESTLLAAESGLREHGLQQRSDLQNAVKRLVRLYEQMDQPEEASKWQAQSVE